MTPALLISRSGPGNRVPMSAAALRTDSSEARSRSTVSTRAPGTAVLTWSAALAVRAGSRPASTTVAPRAASTFAVSRPMPELAPVMTAVRSCWSGTSCAVHFPLTPCTMVPPAVAKCLAQHIMHCRTTGLCYRAVVQGGQAVVRENNRISLSARTPHLPSPRRGPDYVRIPGTRLRPGHDPRSDRDLVWPGHVACVRNGRGLCPRLLPGPQPVVRLVDRRYCPGLRLPHRDELHPQPFRAGAAGAAGRDGTVPGPGHGAGPGLPVQHRPARGLAGRRRYGPVHGWLRQRRVPDQAGPVHARTDLVLRADRADPVRHRADLRPDPARRLALLDPRAGDLRRPDDVRLPAGAAVQGHRLGADARGRDLPGRAERVPVLPAHLLRRPGLTRQLSQSRPPGHLTPPRLAGT